MTDTKEKILSAALRLFARDGYEAVSVSMIAGELNITKSALYKHYESKKDIFDSISRRMSELDAKRAGEYEVPGEAQDASGVSLDAVKRFSKAQFRYWTEDEFASDFRRMLTLEQYRGAEQARLFAQYLSAGPLGYTEELFFAILGDRERAKREAVRFYAPMFLLYSVYDGAEDKSAVTARLEEHINNFTLN